MMTDDGLLQRLQELETELHLDSTVRDAERLAILPHPDFEEFGRSGHAYRHIRHIPQIYRIERHSLYA